MIFDEKMAMSASSETLASTLGIEFVSTPEPDEAVATMKVTKAVSQPAGYLNGGASLAVAENLAGLGSIMLSGDLFPMGMNVTANHLGSVPIGHTIRAVAKILHRGHKTHVWNVDIFDEDGTLVSTARVTNYLINLNRK